MDNHNRTIELNMQKNQDLGLYLHIPFCVKKCDYCDFLSAPATDEIKDKYFDAILTEINSYEGKLQGYHVPTIFFGGGTPSLVDSIYISRIMEAFSNVFCIDQQRLEATIEVNPGTVTKEKLEAYRKAGINRLSFGLQSTNNRELQILGRIHSYEQFKENYYLAREVGFHNINIDLMSALPGQTLASWEKTLNTVIKLKPEHISAYSLIIEEGTQFYDRYQEDSQWFKELPEEETDRLIYHRTKEILEANGYHRYEISNYAKAGYECRHNSSYWLGTQYLGLGLGASSLLADARFLNLQDIKQYIQLCEEYRTNQKEGKTKKVTMGVDFTMNEDLIGLRRDFERLTEKQKMEEFMFLGLRMCEGVSQNTFFHRFGVRIDTVYGDLIKQLTNQSLLVNEDDRIRLTEYGIDVSNAVLSKFLLSE